MVASDGVTLESVFDVAAAMRDAAIEAELNLIWCGVLGHLFALTENDPRSQISAIRDPLVKSMFARNEGASEHHQ